MTETHWHPTIGYFDGNKQFRIRGTSFAPRWVFRASQQTLDEMEIVTKPEFDSSTQTLDKDSIFGWVLRDKTQEEIDADSVILEASETKSTQDAQNKLWKEAWDIWGEKQIASVDRQTINMWATSGLLSPIGMQMLTDLVRWHDTVFLSSYANAKAAIMVAKGWVEPEWDTWPACPHTFFDFVAQRIG